MPLLPPLAAKSRGAIEKTIPPIETAISLPDFGRPVDSWMK
jgi:hypothetical protein